MLELSFANNSFYVVDTIPCIQSYIGAIQMTAEKTTKTDTKISSTSNLTQTSKTRTSTLDIATVQRLCMFEPWECRCEDVGLGGAGALLYMK